MSLNLDVFFFLQMFGECVRFSDRFTIYPVWKDHERIMDINTCERDDPYCWLRITDRSCIESSVTLDDAIIQRSSYAIRPCITCRRCLTRWIRRAWKQLSYYSIIVPLIPIHCRFDNSRAFTSESIVSVFHTADAWASVVSYRKLSSFYRALEKMTH